jgi:hypothetical protein
VQQSRARRKLIILLAVCLLLVTIARIRQIETVADQGYFDKYPAIAGQILGGEDVGERLADYSPAYTAAVTAATASGLSPMGIRRLQLLACGFLALLLGAIAWRAAGPPAGMAAAILLLWNRELFLNATELEPELLILILNTATLAILLTGPPARWRLALAGALLGVSATARPVALLLIAALAIPIWWRSPRQRWKSAAIFCAAAAVPLLLVILLNLRLTGSAMIMDPGSVFYEGMNPYATGYAGVQPRIVNDLEQVTDEPDALHIAYREVAARATGTAPDRDLANRFWTGKAREFASHHPKTARDLTLRKLYFTLASYEPLDLFTVYAKKRELGSFWIPWGFLVSLAAIGLIASRSPLRLPLLFYGAAAFAAPVIFYVTIRQRAPLLPMLTLAAALAVAEIWRAARERNRKRLLLLSAALLAGTILLTLPTRWQREDQHNWEAAWVRSTLAAAASQAPPAGQEELRAIILSWSVDPDLPGDPHRMLESARRELQEAATEARIFDLAISLAASGVREPASQLFAELLASDYRPMRENVTTSSVAYHLARSRLHRGSQQSEIATLLQWARREAAGDAAVLALLIETTPPDEAEALRRELHALHDPYTAALARARAMADTGNPAAAEAQLELLMREFPEWHRPARLQARLQRAGGAAEQP